MKETSTAVINAASPNPRYVRSLLAGAAVFSTMVLGTAAPEPEEARVAPSTIHGLKSMGGHALLHQAQPEGQTLNHSIQTDSIQERHPWGKMVV